MAENANITLTDALAVDHVFEPKLSGELDRSWIKQDPLVPVSQRAYIKTKLRPATSSVKRRVNVNTTVPYLGADGITTEYVSHENTSLVKDDCPPEVVQLSLELQILALQEQLIAAQIESGIMPF